MEMSVEVDREVQYGVKRKGTKVIFSRDAQKCTLTAINVPIAKKLVESYRFWVSNTVTGVALEDVVNLAKWETAWLRTKKEVPHDYLRDRFREQLIREPELGYERAAEIAVFFAEAAVRQAKRRQRGRRHLQLRGT